MKHETELLRVSGFGIHDLWDKLKPLQFQEKKRKQRQALLLLRHLRSVRNRRLKLRVAEFMSNRLTTTRLLPSQMCMATSLVGVHLAAQDLKVPKNLPLTP